MTENSIVEYQSASQSNGLNGIEPTPALHRSAVQDIWIVLRKRRGIVFVSLALAVAVAIVYCTLSTPLYQSKALIEISQDQQDMSDLNMSQMAQGDSDADKKLQTQVQVLTTDSLILQTVDQLKLRNDRWLHKKSLLHAYDPAPVDGELPAATREKILKKFKANLRVTVVPRTEIISVSFDSPNAQLSADVVNSLIRNYQERSYSVRYQAMKGASDWLAKQLTDLKTNTELAQSRLVDYQKKHNILLMGDDQSSNDVVIKLQDLSKQLIAAQTDRVMKEAKYRLAKTGNPELVAQVTENSTLSLLRAQEADLKAQYAEAISKYGSGYPRVAQIRERLGKVQADMAREVNNITEALNLDYQGAADTEQKLNAQVDQLRADAFKINSDAVGYEVLQREVVASQELYQTLKEKLEEAGVLAGLRSNYADSIDPGRPASKPSEPQSLAAVLLASAFGLLGGCCFALIAEKLDDKVSSGDDVESLTGLPSLVFVPQLKRESERIGAATNALDHPRSEFSESFRSLRSAMLLSNNGAPPKVQVVTSTFPGEGKSTVALNAAIAYAQQGARVLLIDGDLRRPTIHQKTGTCTRGGLSKVLSGQVEAADAVVPFDRLPNLHIIDSGPIPPQPSELLASLPMRHLLDFARLNYDFVVVDSPPVLSVTDGVVLSSMADRVLYVCRSRTTSRYALRRALTLLHRVNARVAGIILNAVDSRSEAYYHYYASGKYGSYYSEN